MEYSFIDRTPEQRGENWFGHTVKLYVPNSQAPELVEFLKENFGPRGRSWRYKGKMEHWGFTNHSVIRFAEKRDAMRFKLSWTEYPKAEDPTSIMAWYRKLNLNSQYGRMAKPTIPSWAFSPISQTTSGIYPSIQQIKGRAFNPCNEVIIMDYESKINPLAWYEKWVEGVGVTTWESYNMILDMEIRHEDQQQQTSLVGEPEEEATLQAGL